MSETVPSPTDNRLPELDFLRGFAVLGIFVMNLMGFGLPLDAYMNPAIAGGDQGLDLWVFYLQDAFFDGRMRGIFCLLFGAGLALSFDRARIHGLAGARVLHRRYLLLVLLGLIHIFILQMPGDILFVYGVVALLIWSFAGARPRQLLFLGILLLALTTLIGFYLSFSEHREFQQMASLKADQASGLVLNAEETEALAEWQEASDERSLASEQKNARLRISEIRGASGWGATWWAWKDDMVEAVTLGPDRFHLLSIAGTMLLGIALFRFGFLSGEWSSRAYVLSIGVGLLAALLAHVLTRMWVAIHFSEEPGVLDQQYVLSYEANRILVALAWISSLMLLHRRIGLRGPILWLANTGRMALTIYLAQTVIATSLFFGWGLGWFGQYSRSELMVVAVLVQLTLVLFANMWLLKFRRGPMEALWRRLSYGQPATTP